MPSGGAPPAANGPLMLGELSAEQIERLLNAETVGRLGCHAGDRADVAGRHPVVYKIVIREKTGRFEKR